MAAPKRLPHCQRRSAWLTSLASFPRLLATMRDKLSHSASLWSSAASADAVCVGACASPCTAMTRKRVALAVTLQVDARHQTVAEQERQHVVTVGALVAPACRSRAGNGSRRGRGCADAARPRGRRVRARRRSHAAWVASRRGRSNTDLSGLRPAGAATHRSRRAHRYTAACPRWRFGSSRECHAPCRPLARRTARRVSSRCASWSEGVGSSRVARGKTRSGRS